VRLHVIVLDIRSVTIQQQRFSFDLQKHHGRLAFMGTASGQRLAYANALRKPHSPTRTGC
jgi:hypothetical protein